MPKRKLDVDKRTCTNCKIEKDINDFYLNLSSSLERLPIGNFTCIPSGAFLVGSLSIAETVITFFYTMATQVGRSNIIKIHLNELVIPDLANIVAKFDITPLTEQQIDWLYDRGEGRFNVTGGNIRVWKGDLWTNGTQRFWCWGPTTLDDGDYTIKFPIPSWLVWLDTQIKLKRPSINSMFPLSS